jgi:hypothetical protein
MKNDNHNTIDTTSIDTLLSTLLAILPDATIGEDEDGQVIIYTDRYQVGDSSTDLVTGDEYFKKDSAQ